MPNTARTYDVIIDGLWFTEQDLAGKTPGAAVVDIRARWSAKRVEIRDTQTDELLALALNTYHEDKLSIS